MDFGILFSLIIQSKKHGKGRLGNARIYVRLMQIIADMETSGISSELNILRKFGSSTADPDSYQRIDKMLSKLLKGHGDYPYQIFTFSNYETASQYEYRLYIHKMSRFIDDVIDEKKMSQLILSIIEQIKQNENIDTINYGGRYIRKCELIGTYSHPKKICAEALLLGMVYCTHKNSTAFGYSKLLEEPDRMTFRAVRYADESSLDTKLEMNIEKNICDNSLLEERLWCENIQKKYTVDVSDFKERKVFLYGIGASGKTTYLRGLSCRIKLFVPLYMYEKTNGITGVNYGILSYLLLRYHYQSDYKNIESCMVCEGRDNIIKQLNELEKLLSIVPQNNQPKYTLILDGWNEICTDKQHEAAEELRYIIEKWNNVRVIVSGRIVPKYSVFDDFQTVEMKGIIVSEVNEIITHLKENDKIMQNTELMELLKYPLFMNIFLDSQNLDANFSTCGELLDFYVMNNLQRSEICGFLVKFALPFAAKHMTDRREFTISRADISDAVNMAFETFVDNERVFQNCIAPLGYRKKALLECRADDDITERIIEESGFLRCDSHSAFLYSFTHQYYRDYFAAKYILNFAEAMKKSYENVECFETENLLKKSALDFLWFPDRDHDGYRLIGEISGDYRNKADYDMEYRKTILDDILEMSRYFHGMRITENILNVMAISRNKLICGVDFRQNFMPMSISPNLKFSLDGEFPCCFYECRFPDTGVFGGKINSMAYSSDDSMLVLCYADGYTILYDAKNDIIEWELDLSQYTEFGFDYCEFKDNELLLVSLESCLKINVETQNITVISQADKNRITNEYYEYADRISEPDIKDDVLCKIYQKLNHFKNCDFRDAEFIIEENKKYTDFMNVRI